MKKVSCYVTILLSFVFSSNILAQVPSYVPTNGLVSYWPFSGNANDHAGSNNGTVFGAVLTSGHLGNANSAYKFDGFSGDYIDLGTSNSIKTSTMTISMWVLIDSNQHYSQAFNYHPFIVSRNSNYPNAFFEAYAMGYYLPTSKFVALTYKPAGTGPEKLSTNTVTLKQWYHHVIAFTNDSLYYYIDAVLQGKVHKAFTTTYLAGSPVLLGKTGNAVKEGYLNGKLDDIGIWNRRLTQAEINALYNGAPSDSLPDARFTSSEPGCVGHLENFYSVMSGTPGVTHSWNFGTGASPGTSTDVDPAGIVYSAAGAKLVTHIVTTVLGSDTVTNIITINPTPTASFSSNAPVCEAAAVNLSNTGSSGIGYAYSWDLGQDATPPQSAAQNPMGVLYTTDGTKTITQYITNQYGCTSINTETITINSLPNVMAGNDTTICPNTSVQLGTSSTSGYNYTWFPSSTLTNSSISNPTASPITSINVYALMVTNSTTGCKNYDTVIVTMLDPVIANAGIDVAICNGDSIQIGAGLVNGQNYQWQPSTGLSSSTLTNPIASPSVTTTYTISSSRSTCMIITDEVTVTVHPLPAADAGVNDTIANGSSIQLVATGGVQYQWEPALLLSNAGINDPTASPFLTTTFTVTVTDVNSCVNTDTVKITVVEPGIWLPNAFTPGGNGQNDIFYVRGKGIENFEFAIFNRWGEQIFYSKDMSKGWDGSKQPTGEELPEGAYVYIVKGELTNGEAVSMKGLVNLIR